MNQGKCYSAQTPRQGIYRKNSCIQEMTVEGLTLNGPY